MQGLVSSASGGPEKAFGIQRIHVCIGVHKQKLVMSSPSGSLEMLLLGLRIINPMPVVLSS